MAAHHLVSWPIFQALFISAEDTKFDALRIFLVNLIVGSRRLQTAAGGDTPTLVGLVLLQAVIGFALPVALTQTFMPPVVPRRKSTPPPEGASRHNFQHTRIPPEFPLLFH